MKETFVKVSENPNIYCKVFSSPEGEDVSTMKHLLGNDDLCKYVTSESAEFIRNYNYNRPSSKGGMLYPPDDLIFDSDVIKNILRGEEDIIHTYTYESASVYLTAWIIYDFRFLSKIRHIRKYSDVESSEVGLKHFFSLHSPGIVREMTWSSLNQLECLNNYIVSHLSTGLSISWLGDILDEVDPLIWLIYMYNRKISDLNFIYENTSLKNTFQNNTQVYKVRCEDTKLHMVYQLCIENRTRCTTSLEKEIFRDEKLREFYTSKLKSDRKKESPIKMLSDISERFASGTIVFQ